MDNQENIYGGSSDYAGNSMSVLGEYIFVERQ